jgi:glycosyltransferase involved in cell wall biosynthesis
MEAMLAEVPVVAAAAGGTVELIHDGETGLLFPPEDLATALRQLARLTKDGSLRSRLSRQARRRIELAFDCNVMVSQFAGLYRRILEPQAQSAAFPVENEL